MSIFGVVLVTYDLLTLELLCVCVLLFLVFFLLLLSAFIANKRVHITRGTEQTTFLPNFGASATFPC